MRILRIDYRINASSEVDTQHGSGPKQVSSPRYLLVQFGLLLNVVCETVY